MLITVLMSVTVIFPYTLNKHSNYMLQWLTIFYFSLQSVGRNLGVLFCLPVLSMVSRLFWLDKRVVLPS